MLNLKRKNILSIGGMLSIEFGIVGAIPSFLREQYIAATLSTFLIVGGLVLLAISFGE